MSSRSDYFKSLSQEMVNFSNFDLVSTFISIGVFFSVVTLVFLRKESSDARIAKLPLEID